jgi:hypothetical protein
MIHEVLISIFGRPLAERIYEVSYDSEMSCEKNMTVFNGVKFAAFLDIPKRANISNHLTEKYTKSRGITEQILNHCYFPK